VTSIEVVLEAVLARRMLQKMNTDSQQTEVFYQIAALQDVP
jgi:hypothetical protein